VSLFKTSGGLFAAIANFSVLMTSDELLDVIKDFIAVAIIYEVDNIISATVSSSDCKAKEDLCKKPLTLSSDADSHTDYDLYRIMEDQLHPLSQFTLFCFVLFERLFSITFMLYFYFMPLVVSFLFIYKNQMELGFRFKKVVK
jgi:hypothetical protein